MNFLDTVGFLSCQRTVWDHPPKAGDGGGPADRSRAQRGEQPPEKRAMPVRGLDIIDRGQL